MVSAIFIGAVLIAVGSLLAWRRHGQQRGRERDDDLTRSGGDRQLSSRAPRHDTALDELRAMRDALKPAEHSRVERRRPGGSGGARPDVERRRAHGAAARAAAPSAAQRSSDAET